MNKKEIVIRLKKMDFDINSYWVIAGGAMVLQGIRSDTKDIDIACTTKMFCSLETKGYSVTKNSLGYRKISLEEDIEVFENWDVLGIDYIEGIPTANIESIREMKIVMGREKDLEDVKLIDDMLIKSKE